MKRLFSLLILSLTLSLGANAATKILGTPQATIDRMYQFVMSKNPGSSFSREIAATFYNLGVKYGIRGDIALCQSCIETGWFRYTGGTAVTPSDHNYCGLGVTTKGQKGCQFSTIAEGVAAQLQHLWAYATTAALPSGWTKVDPRFNYVSRGCAPTWEGLGGKWATSSTYGTQIISVYNDMMSYTVANPSLKASKTSLTFSAQQDATAPSQTVTITGANLSSKIIYNSSTSAVKVSSSNWDDYTGGKLIITLDTSKSPATYSGYVAVQSGSGTDMQRLTIQISATITAKPSPTITVSPASLSFTAKQGESIASKSVTVTAKDLDQDMTYASSSSMFTVTPGSNWNARTGGTLTVSVNTDRTPSTYTGYIAVQTTSSLRKTVDITAVINAKDDTPATPTITMSPTNITLSATQGQKNPTANITVSAANLTSDISVNSSNSAISITKGSNWNARTGGTLIATLDASRSVGTYTSTIAAQSGTTRATATVNGTINEKQDTGEIPVLDFKEIWNLSTTAGNASFATSVRNFDVMNGKMYCVHNTSEIIVLDARTGVKTGTLSNGSVVTGGTLTLCDVKCHNGKIYACNLKSTPSGELRVYRWDSDDSEPVLILSTSDTQGVTRVGDCLYVTGSDNDLWLAFARNENSATSIVEFNSKNGGAWTSKKVNVTDGSSNIQAGASVRVKPTGSGYWIDGGQIYPTYLNLSGQKQYALSGETVTSGNDFDTFTYDGRQYAMVASYLNKNATSLADGIMRLFDITDGWDKATAKGYYPATGLGATRNTVFSGGVVTEAGTRYVEAWILASGQGIAYYRSGELSDDPIDPQPGDDDSPITDVPDKFTTTWTYAQTGKTIDIGYVDLGTVMSRNMALRGDNLYVAQRGSSDCDIVIVDANTGAQKGTLPASNITAGTWKFASVAALSDAIVATNLATTASSTLNVYAWTSDTAEPTLILSTTNHGTRAGDVISASGSMANGKLYFASNNGHAGQVYVYTITNGSASATPTVITLKDASGSTFDLGGGLAVIEIKANADGTFYASGKGGYTGLFKADGTLISQMASAAVEGNSLGSSISVVDYGDFKLAASITYANSIEQAYLTLANITDGLNNAKLLKSYAPIGTSGTRNTTFVSTAIARVNKKDVDLWAMVPGQGIAKYQATKNPSAVEDIAIEPTAAAITYDGHSLKVVGADAVNIAAYTMSGMLIANIAGDTLDAGMLSRGIYIVVATLADGSRLSSRVAVR